jgi:hypothetical protein
MTKFILAILSLTIFNAHADTSLLGKEQTKKFVRYALWYEGVELTPEAKAQMETLSAQNDKVYLGEEILLPLEKLDI